MKIRNVFILMAALVSGLYFSGCTEEDGTPTGNPPTAVQVTGMGGNPGGYTFGVRWTRASNDVGANKIVATPVAGSAAATEVVTSSTATSGTITVPTSGKYTITVQASDGSNSTGVEWATTTRSNVLTIYETADNTPGHGSGLILGTPGETGATAEVVSITGPKASQVDLVLATDNSLPAPGPYLALQGADVAGSGIPGGRATRIGNGPFQVVGGLDGDFYSDGIEGEFTSNFNSQPLPGTASNPYIILVKTADAAPHYARVQIIPQPITGLLWKDVTGAGGPYRAIDVVVSYQPMSATGYVTRPGVMRGFNTTRANAPKAARVKN